MSTASVSDEGASMMMIPEFLESISTGSVGRSISYIESSHGGLCSKLQPWHWGFL